MGSQSKGFLPGFGFEFAFEVVREVGEDLLAGVVGIFGVEVGRDLGIGDVERNGRTGSEAVGEVLDLFPGERQLSFEGFQLLGLSLKFDV